MLIENKNRTFKVIDFDYSPAYKDTEGEAGEDECLVINELQVKFKGAFVSVNLRYFDVSRLIELENEALKIHNASFEPDYDSMREGK